MEKLKFYERLLVLLVALTFLLQFFPLPGKSILYFVMSWSLAIFYITCSCRLFSVENKNGRWRSICAGIAFAASVSTWPFTIRLKIDMSIGILSAANILLFSGLVLFVLLQVLKKNKIEMSIKKILFRSLIILLVTSFFTYVPIKFSFYRTVLSALNIGLEGQLQNIQIFEYGSRYQEALTRGDCQDAIHNAKIAMLHGKFWIGTLDSLSLPGYDWDNRIDSTFKSKEKSISGTHYRLYKAYRCQAQQDYDQEKYDLSLAGYYKAAEYLDYFNSMMGAAYDDKVWLLNDIALVYDGLKEHDKADSLYNQSISLCKGRGEPEWMLATLYANYARNLSKNENYSESNSYYEKANTILVADTSDENKYLIEKNYNRIAMNYIRQDSLELTKRFLEKSLTMKSENSNHCQAKLYKGICAYKEHKYQYADSLFKSCLNCKESEPDLLSTEPGLVNYWLAETNVSLALYPKATEYINITIPEIERTEGKVSISYANSLRVLAQINQIMANYPAAKKQLEEVLKIYNASLGERSFKSALVLVELSELEVIYSNYRSAKALSDTATSIASDYTNFTDLSSIAFTNNSAYINYCLGNYIQSANLYSQVFKINKRFGKLISPSNANTLNGLGLVETNTGNYLLADSLLKESLKINESVFSHVHPHTAVILINQSALYIKQGRIAEAEKNLNKALEINRKVLSADNDVFGDIYSGFGDIALIKKQRNEAKVHYEKALNIYKVKFEESHAKVAFIRNKLKKL